MSTKILHDNLSTAAYELAAAYVAELEQYPLKGIEAEPTLTTPLDALLQDLIYKGALEAVMSATTIRGNQSKASKVFGVHRATLRRRLEEQGYAFPRNQEAA